MRQAAAKRIFLRSYSSSTCPGTVKSHAFDGRCSIRFGAVVRMSKQSGGRTCNKDGQPEPGAVSLLDSRNLCRDRADAVAGKRAPTRLGRSSQSCGSELAREGAGTAATTAETEPTSSRTSPLPQRSSQPGLHRHAEGKGCALFERGVHVDAAFVRQGDLAGDIQPQTQSGLRLVSGRA